MAEVNHQPRGLTQLFTELCDLQLKKERRKAHLIQPKLTNEVKIRRMRRHMYDILFQHLRGPHRVSNIPILERHLSEMDMIYSKAFDMRSRKKYDDADNLEKTAEKFMSAAAGEDLGTVVLKFLLCLADSNQTPKEFHSGTTSPAVFPKESAVCLPQGPREYGDSIVPVKSMHYMHYPSDIFDGLCFNKLTTNIPSDPFLNLQIFDAMPGENLPGYGVFNITGSLKSSYEQQVSNTLFGGLVDGHTRNINVKLDLPLLESGNRTYKFNSFESLDDEGFVDTAWTGSTPGSSAAPTPDLFCMTPDPDVWDLAVKELGQPKRYVWEHVGRVQLEKEKPFLTEAGPQAFDAVYLAHMASLDLIASEPVMPVLRKPLTMKTLVKDLLGLLIGLPSHTFIYCQDKERFEIASGTYISGLSPESLASACEPLVQCATFYARLEMFSQPSVIDSHFHKGLIFQAFSVAVRKYLQHYRGTILSINHQKTLLELRHILQGLMRQMRYLANLCWCGEEDAKNQKDFPTGVTLISYLYKEALECAGSVHYTMLLSLLNNACRPYLLFLQDWVFHGVCRDIYSEFMIEENDEYLTFRDINFWSKGYALVQRDAEDCSVPLFLSHLANDIFVCGKAINLLRVIQPQHFLLAVEHAVPRVVLTFHEEDLAAVQAQCDAYLARMTEIARQTTVNRQQLLAAKAAARSELAVRARHAASEQIARIQARINEARRREDARKRVLFAELKDQMEKDLRRRASEKEQEKDEDRQRVEALDRQELLEFEADERLHEEARAELIEYYERLTEKATAREKRALWHVRRKQLAMTRQLFLEQDDARLRLELTDVADGKAVPVSEPVKAVSVDADTDLTFADDATALPTWARKGLNAQAPVFGLDEIATEDIPKWARPVFEKLDENKAVGKTAGQSSDASPKSKWLRKTPVKSSIKFIEGHHATSESHSAPDAKSSVKVDKDKNMLQETESLEERPHIKANVAMHSTKESEGEVAQKSHIKLDEHGGITRQTEEKEERQHLKSVEGRQANVETEEKEEKSHLKFNPNFHSGTESKVEPSKVYKPSMFGHISQLSMQEFTMAAPRMKRQLQMHANKESDERFDTSFTVKTGRRKRVEGQDINKQSEETDGLKTKIRVVPKMHASVESELIDMDAQRLAKFKTSNQFGHSSHSSVQKLLYGTTYGSGKEQEEIKESAISKSGDIQFWSDSQLEPYQDSYSILDEAPLVELRSWLPPSAGPTEDDDDVSAFHFVSLPALLQQSVTAPLMAQIRLVNSSIVDHFLAELGCEQHFKALRRFILMQDGEFSQSLSDQLCEKLGRNPSPHELLNPIFLNSVLSRALRSSIKGDQPLAANVNFVLRFMPKHLASNDPNSLDCLELTYHVDWPLNIVITENCLSKYSRVFSLMLQLKRTVWTLKDIWHHLKRDAMINNASMGVQFRQLQLYRHEMEHFVRVMQGYLANQVLHVSWAEFADDLGKVTSLDDLREKHTDYLNKCLFRCLLNKKASSVMKIIQDTFGLILKFRSQLVTQHWYRDRDTSEMCHPAFENMGSTYKSFNEFSRFLFRVVNKLAMRGYQPHLQELLLRLNFNSYYKAETFHADY